MLSPGGFFHPCKFYEIFRVYEICQYRRYRARKNYNLALFKDAAEDNLEPEVLNELADDQKEFLESLDLTNPVDSLHETEKHRTHGLLHVIEKLTCLGVSAFT